jgi:hypothetical protein
VKEEGLRASSYFQQLPRDASKIVTLSSAFTESNPLEEVLNKYSELFSGQLRTVKGAEYEIELTDQVPVRSPPYHCASPKLKLLTEFVEDLLQKGVVRPSKSPYVSPVLLLPKSGGWYRMVVDYCKVNKKICFDLYPLPKIEQAFQHFSGATLFSALDLNSAYYQIPLTPQGPRITAFCTPLGLYKFNKLPMGISIGCKGLSHVVDNLFADLKVEYVFNYLDDLAVYSASLFEHQENLREVLGRLQSVGFTLNREKIVLGASEIKYLGHYLSCRGIRVIPDTVKAIRQYPCPRNLHSARRFLGMVSFYARFIPKFSLRAATLHRLKGKGIQFEWGEKQQASFESLKTALCEALVLQVPHLRRILCWLLMPVILHYQLC